MASPSLFCADIGGSFIKLAVSKAPGQVELLEQYPNPAQSWPDFVAALSQLLLRYKDHCAADAPLAISTTGVVNSRQDSILAGNIPAYQGHAIRAELEQALGRPVFIANDADCFTLAEACVGSAQDSQIVLGAILGTGVGGGLVIHGQIIEGRKGITAEWGHGPITKTMVMVAGKQVELPRLRCGCGQHGCLDTYGGARGIERLHMQLHHISSTSKTIVADWHHEGKQATQTIQIWLELVSEPLAYTINILGADKVVVGGGLSSDPILIAQLDKTVKTKILSPDPFPLVVPGKFSQNGGLIGASLLANNYCITV